MNADQYATPDARTGLSWVIAGATAGAGLIHFAVISEHTGGDVIVPIGFALFGWAQVAVAAVLLTRRAPWALQAAIAVNATALAMWAYSRTIGLPFEPYGGAPEAVGSLDLTAAVLSAIAVTLAVGEIAGRSAIRLPRAAAAFLGIAGIAIASVVVIDPGGDSAGTTTAASTSSGGTAGGGGGHHGGGGTAASTADAGSADAHAADMLRIDRARCDLAFNPKAYWEEARAMGIDTYTGGSMAMPAPTAMSEVADPQPLEGRGSGTLDTLISLTTRSSGEGAAAQLITELAGASDAEYDAWRRWVAENPGDHSMAAPTPTTNGQPPPASMGHPGPVTWTALVDREQCDQLTAELEQAREVSEKYATVADAEAAGWNRVTGYVPGIAAHYMNFSLVDSKFAIDEPEMLLFDGTDPESQIVGLSYYVRLDGSAAPTQGFVGENDQYHRHFGLCTGPGGVIGDSTTTEAECAARGGRKASGANGWMSHAWVVPGCESPWGVFSGENPILDQALSEASGEPDASGCAQSSVRDRYDLRAGESDLRSNGGGSGGEQAAGE